MIRKTKGNKVTYEFKSLMDVKTFIDTTKRIDFYKDFHRSDEINYRRTKFTETESYEQAEQFMLYGWDEGTKKINQKLKGNISYNTGNGYKNKQVYGVQGFQACVPRYLQGVPENMIGTKRVVTKQKVINIYRNIVYDWKVKTNTIMDENIKVFKCIQKLEAQGYRVNLNVVCGVKNKGTNTIITVKIKDAGQRLNIKQTVFPLVHPSMLRRICFAIIERVREVKSISYGTPIEDASMFKDCYYFPAIINEDEITDINKYKI